MYSYIEHYAPHILLLLVVTFPLSIKIYKNTNKQIYELRK